MLPLIYYFNNNYLIVWRVSSYHLFFYASFYFLTSDSVVILYSLNTLCNSITLTLNYIRLNMLISKTIEMMSLNCIAL